MSDEYRLTVREDRNSWERNQETTDAMVEKSKVRDKPKAGVAPDKKDQDKRSPGDKKVDTL
jgi:hypothetical protein